jgi:hypothetical protein
VLRSLRASGWKDEPGAAPGVLRLVSETEDAVAARQRLAAQFPEAYFGFNYVYDLASDVDRVRPPDGMSRLGACDPQRCYGPELIRWRPSLAACAAGVKIGVIDTPVDRTHPALAWKELDIRRRPGSNSQPHWHGTAVLSLLTGHAKSGTPGLVPNASYLIVEAFNISRLGKPESDTDHLLWALDEMERAGAQVVNMSWTGPRDDLIEERLIELSHKGMVFVAAAGNGGRDAPPAYPAAYVDEVIAVTAVDRDQRVFEFANHGDYIDVAAPGVRIWTALPNNKQGMQTGTSFAAPFVTAIVATLYKSAVLPAINGAHETSTPEAVTLSHLSTEKSVRDETVGLGLVRAPLSCAGEEHQPPPSRSTPMVQSDRRETHIEYVSSSASGN